MNDLEKKAYKCCLMWVKVCQKMFPKERYSKLRQAGDPRKSYLFKCCYTLVSDTTKKLADNEYKLYIYAQCDILRNIKDGNIHANIDPNCLIGCKAWARWKVWEKKYEKSKEFSGAERDIRKETSAVIRDLNKTKDFLLDIFKTTPTAEDLKKASENRVILKWVHYHKITPYFVLLCPHIDNNQNWGMDLTIYQKDITQEVEAWYKENFE